MTDAPDTQPDKFKQTARTGVKGCLSIGAAITILVALGIYCAFPHPTYDQTELKAIAAESQRLMVAYPVGPTAQSAHVPKDKWPPAISSLKPYSVVVRHGMVDITTKPFFDGGWGYGFATDKRNLTMLVECWSELGQGVYWHGPC
jgi:poly(3-hydroxybutyrate) depolymerase